MKTERKIIARLVRQQDDDRTFDLEFWQQAGVDARFEAAWQMVLDMLILKGEDVDEYRLQRSVENIERIQR